jgi:hypothetical protein
MSNTLQIRATWSGEMDVVALVGHLSLYRADSHALALLQLADSLGGITEVEVCLLYTSPSPRD